MATSGSAAQEGSGSSVTADPVTGIVPGQYWLQTAQNIAYDGDQDSALGSDGNAESTASIASSILEYRTIQGRTYHSERGNARYWGLNDDQQNESMDINDFADQFPNTAVIGTDISPIQPSWVPPNLRFEIEDCTIVWTYPSDSFDYVHIRWLNGSIDDWGMVFKEAYRICKPGGFIESFEGAPCLESDDGTVKDTDAVGQWGKIFVEYGRRSGRSFTTVSSGIQKKAIQEAGFVAIEEKDIKTPIGDWSQDPTLKDIGRYAHLALTKDVEGYLLLATSELGWAKEESLVFAAQIRRELRSKKHHVYYRQKIVWGKKPEAS
ncbi:S-adenosyl-L-methionine-dependent methyltransferase [Phialemonium atrogriseum]|uniref:S-adenosyl-L-methionine-dependent methyltransferase n=1 Tax=Phialemonium atrogriseum TaxID=1093897 RepID=A0AAJ0BRG2_9PEZI|nr:S-adenosyl-L-methionine-dependent methyltransferase [Phialemonium atrogriseum]KAK1762048.1 S-adenosyl-L-methionine-dependent methyltransferase [Phialemonium atrogriseum]